MHGTSRRLTVAIVVMAVGLAAPAFACECIARTGPASIPHDARAIIATGRVTSVHLDADTPILLVITDIDVTEGIKNATSGSHIRVYGTGTTACGYDFQEGRDYVIVTEGTSMSRSRELTDDQLPPGGQEVSSCGATRLLGSPEGQRTLAELRAAVATAPPSVASLFSLGDQGPAFMLECTNTSSEPIPASRLQIPLRIDGNAVPAPGGTAGSFAGGIPTLQPGARWTVILKLSQTRAATGNVAGLNANLVIARDDVRIATGRHTFAFQCLDQWSEDLEFYWQSAPAAPPLPVNRP